MSGSTQATFALHMRGDGVRVTYPVQLDERQRDGLACVVCGRGHGPDGMVPIGHVYPDGPAFEPCQVFRHVTCSLAEVGMAPCQARQMSVAPTELELARERGRLHDLLDRCLAAADSARWLTRANARAYALLLVEQLEALGEGPVLRAGEQLQGRWAS